MKNSTARIKTNKHAKFKASNNEQEGGIFTHDDTAQPSTHTPLSQIISPATGDDGDHTEASGN